ncbi:nucleotidyltransferase domain-containing protein [Spirosoma areae]
MTYGLTNTQLAQIKRVIAQNPRLQQAVLFGSRAKGTAKPGSDVDLALLGESLRFKDLLRLDNELEELSFSFSFDLIIYQQISDPDVREHIDRVGVTLYSRDLLAT